MGSVTINSLMELALFSLLSVRKEKLALIIIVQNHVKSMENAHKAGRCVSKANASIDAQL